MGYPHGSGGTVINRRDSPYYNGELSDDGMDFSKKPKGPGKYGKYLGSQN